MPTAKVTKNVSAAIGGGNVLCSTLISIKTKAWLYSFHCFSGHSCLRLESVAHPPRDNGAARRTPREQDNRSWPIATT